MAIQPINSGRAPIIWSTVDEAFSVINENFAELDARTVGATSSLTNGSYTLTLDESGNLNLPAGGDILNSEGFSVLGYTLPTASTMTLGGVKVDGTSITIADGVISAVGGEGGGGGVGLSSRVSLSVTTSILTNGETGNVTINGFKGYLLYKIDTSGAAWVRIYTDTLSRTADQGRSELTDPLPGSGVVAEVITTGAESVVISPGAVGFSNESIPDSNIRLAVTNKTGLATTITVTLTVVQLEA